MKDLGKILLGIAALVAVFSGSVFGPSGAGPPGERATMAAPADPAVTAPAPPAAGYVSPDAIRIARDASGQFQLELAVNNTPVRFLIDTGADIVALTAADAERAGIPVSTADYQPILQTASGKGWGAPVRLDRLDIGHAELRDVDAVIVRDLAVSLLGQSVLRRIGRLEMTADEIVLEPNI